MVVRAIDERYSDGGATKGSSGRESTEAPAEDHDMRNFS